MVAGGLLLLLPLLAAMQYRLLQKVSEGERERMRASLQASANRFSVDFDQEIIRIYSAFLTAQPPEATKSGTPGTGPAITPGSVKSENADGDRQIELLETAYQRWHETTAYPRLLEGIYLVRWVRWNDEDRPSLTRISLDATPAGAPATEPESRVPSSSRTGSGSQVEWPVEMAALREQLEQRELALGGRREPGGGTMLMPAVTLGNGQPALVFQLVSLQGGLQGGAGGAGWPAGQSGPATTGTPGSAGAASPGQGGGADRGPLGIVIATINLSYLEQEMLPALVRHHFVEGDRQHFEMAVSARGESEDALWRMEAGASRATLATWKFSESDLSVQLFNLRSDLLRQQLRRWRPSTDPKPPPPGAIRLAAVGGRLIFTDELPALWDLHLRHYSGSLDLAVASARRTNLMISLAILFLLTASFMLMMVSSIRARRLAQEQMNFVAGVSHELRTPLAVIDSAGYNLSRGVVKRPEAMREYGEMIRTECRRLGEMVEQVLDFATFRSGRQVFDYHPLSLTDIIEEAVRASQPLLEESGFRIEQQIPEPISGAPPLPMVMADRQALIRALRNLLSNAMKYGGEDRWIGLRLSVSRRGRQEMVNLTISDHGRGIAREDLAHIFEPFYRSSDVRTAQIQGNGLGLSLVRNIVESHRGAISVESQIGRGSDFTISLPAVEGTTAVAVDYLLTERAVRTP